MNRQLELVSLADYHDDSLRTVEKIEIWHDQIPPNPRKWDNLGEMVIRKVMDLCGDRTVGDDDMRSLMDRCRGLPDWESGDYPEHDDLVERYDNDEISEKEYRAEGQELINKYKKEPLVWLPIYALVHSGIWLSTTKSFNGYTCQWDTSFAGIIYAENEKIIEEYGDLSAESRAKAIACFEAEIKTYEQYLQGDIYGFSTLDAEGEQIDSCGGFFGSNPFENGMSEHIEACYHDLLKVAGEDIKYGN
jgi:hypothetical protein